MNFFQRLTTSFSANIEEAVSSLENHDAIIEQNLRQMKRHIARTKARKTTLKAHLEQLTLQRAQAQETMTLWEDRARGLAESDEDKALACLNRRNQCEKQATDLALNIEQQDSLIMTIEDDIRKMESQYERVRTQQNLLRSRQSVADTSGITTKLDQCNSLNQTFERWESSLCIQELDNSIGTETDSFELEFRRQEEHSKLKQQLQTLKSNS